jgi:hypothetical protein
VIEGADDQVLPQANAMINRVSVELLVSQPSLTIDAGGAGPSYSHQHGASNRERASGLFRAWTDEALLDRRN